MPSNVWRQHFVAFVLPSIAIALLLLLPLLFATSLLDSKQTTISVAHIDKRATAIEPKVNEPPIIPAIPPAYRKYALGFGSRPCVVQDPSSFSGSSQRIIVINATRFRTKNLYKRVELTIQQQMSRITRRMIQEGYAFRFARCGPRLKILRAPYNGKLLSGSANDMNQALLHWLDAVLPPELREENNFLVYTNSVDKKFYKRTGGFAQVAQDNQKTTFGMVGAVFVSPKPRELKGFRSLGFPVDAVTMHELLHLLGAVDNRAKHTTGFNHCFDEKDIMCYRDGGPHWRPLTKCQGKFKNSLMAPIDCRRDDYFDPKHRLDRKGVWNIANSPLLMRLPDVRSRDP